MSQFLQQNIQPAGTDAVLTRGVLVRRFCAFVIDCVLIGILDWLLAIVIFLFGILTLGLGFLLWHIIPLLPLLYYTLLVGGRGTTPGQRLMGLSVRRDVDLGLPDFAQAFVWALLLCVSFLLACLPFALALVGPRHRAGHDLLSGLVVVRN